MSTMKIAMLHGPRDLRIEEHPLDTNLAPNQVHVETQISAFKIGTDRGNYEGAEPVAGAPDYPRWVGDSNLGVVVAAGNQVTRLRVGDRVVSRRPHQSAYVADADEVLPLIYFLAGEAASMMSGCCVPIDAGEGKSYAG